MKNNYYCNTIGLAQYALITQKSGLVAIVEPEVLVLEGDHDVTTSEKITQEVLQEVFYWLKEFQVDLSEILLKPNMILAGKDSPHQPAFDEIVEKTFNVLKNTVPDEVPGIVFLSSGLSPDEATNYLKELNKKYPQSPWQLSFSYGRALQEEALKAWGGQEENIKTAQQVFLKRAEKVSQARYGK